MPRWVGRVECSLVLMGSLSASKSLASGLSEWAAQPAHWSLRRPRSPGLPASMTGPSSLLTGPFGIVLGLEVFGSPLEWAAHPSHWSSRDRSRHRSPWLRAGAVKHSAGHYLASKSSLIGRAAHYAGSVNISSRPEVWLRPLSTQAWPSGSCPSPKSRPQDRPALSFKSWPQVEDFAQPGRLWLRASLSGLSLVLSGSLSASKSLPSGLSKWPARSPDLLGSCSASKSLASGRASGPVRIALGLEVFGCRPYWAGCRDRSRPLVAVGLRTVEWAVQLAVLSKSFLALKSLTSGFIDWAVQPSGSPVGIATRPRSLWPRAYLPVGHLR